ncbi:uncharacterized protein RJT21DRAFT_119391 [Scheffersomyces amazonensis]|uniref:uncharacterized protein n=1 Tax=Scheffersomyces amazonensis TaxID=1078765 RepID=UPI00315D2266
MSYSQTNGAEPSLIDGFNEIQSDEIDSQPYNAPPTYSEYSVPLNPTVQSTVPPPVDGKSHMFQINFYRAYFNLDTDTFFLKIQKALNPLSSISAPTDEDDNQATELYGFIWITGTLIFLMFVSSTGANILSNWLHPTNETTKYEYSFELLTLSMSLFYGYNFLIPLILYLWTSFVLHFPQRISLTKLISIYGYTNVLWFPITAINFLIVILVNNKNHHLILNLLEWIIVAVSGLVTGLSNLSKIGPIINKNALLLYDGNSQAANRLYLIAMGALAFSHIIFTVLVKISFFGIKV